MKWDNISNKITQERPDNNDNCPYKGLKYYDFNERDFQFFFGREKLINQLVDNIRHHNFLAVLGAAGSGKSSVVRAGLLNRLQSGRDIAGSDRWLIRIFRPGGHPLRNLAMAFLESHIPAFDRANQLKEMVSLIQKDSIGLARLINDKLVDKHMVLVLDSFEDVFTLCQNDKERWSFFESLVCALKRTQKNLSLIILLRSDFLSECQIHSEFAKLIQNNAICVKPMNKEELRESISKPAEKVNLEIEPELLAHILENVSNSLSTLPLLQYALKKLWNERKGNKLTLAAYNQLKLMHSFKQKRLLCHTPKFNFMNNTVHSTNIRHNKSNSLIVLLFFIITIVTVANIYWLHESQFLRKQAEIEKSIAIQQVNNHLQISEQIARQQKEITRQQQELVKQRQLLIQQEQILNARQALFDKQQLDFTVKILNSLANKITYHLKIGFDNFVMPVQTLKNCMSSLWHNSFNHSNCYQFAYEENADFPDQLSPDYSVDYEELTTHENTIDNEEPTDTEEIQIDLQEVMQTIEKYEKLTLEFPQDRDIQKKLSIYYEKLGDIQSELGQLKKALQSFEQALKINEKLSQIDSKDIEIQKDLSFNYERLGDIQLNLTNAQAALFFFQKALHINKNLAKQNANDVESLRNLAISYENLGDAQLMLNNKALAFESFQESLKIAETLVLQHTDNEEFQQNLSINFSNLGLFFLQTEELDKAHYYFMQALHYGKQHDRVYLSLGQIAELKKETNQALKWYEKIGQGLEYVDAQTQIATILNAQGQWQEAIRRLHAVSHSAEDSDKLTFMQIEAELLTEQKLYSQAMEVYNRALQINPKHLDLLYMRGLLAGKMNCMTQLERDLRHILSIDPNHIEALNALGYSLADRTDRYEESYQLLKKVLNLQPDNFYVLDSMGWVLYKMGDYEQALKYLYKVQPLKGVEFSEEFFVENAGHLGEVLWVSGDEESAKILWKKALEKFPDNEKLQKITQYFIQ